MSVSRAISLTKLISLTQWDKIILTLGLTCFLPFLVHVLPAFQAMNVGLRWLPIFYAPLIASLCFRPHVAVIVGLLAPTVNHLLFGMPNESMMFVLTFELVIFNASVALLQTKAHVSGWKIILAFMATRLLSILCFGQGTLSSVGNYYFQSLITILPGLLMLGILTELVHFWQRRQHS